MKTVQTHSKFFIIGNADEQNSIAHLIQHDDIVVRFNNPNPNCTLKADWIFIANGYTQIRHLVIEHQFLKPETQIFFRYSKKDIFYSRYQNIPMHKRIKYLWRFPKWIKKSQLDQYFINTIPSNIYRHCADSLGFRQPSTGLLAIDYICQQYPKNTVYIHNFTSEGWTGHNWDDEKQLIHTWVKTGRIIAI
ncbi:MULTISPECIES: hypothetical protein [unclassified Snodgrassella]|uniref:hypothetical protein n=1 Tax=Snodgrassella TaxID=1193515 RepID=UPI00226A45DA|nr:MULTISPECIES: hypothetical protein [unclassified Snodgrassella]MCX8746962.1 hypothetical protein [Snodgrassella sp. B3800]MCX8748725.1 hypothetical protein [Snodgrassella sp. B3088]MCX8753372.1 hypothetical protein [Snodgrassella sp. B3837]